MFKFPAEILEKFIRNPVMALYCITGIELDAFQRARLRFYWFVPHKVDSSGWGTGKTIEEWGYAILRAVLLPDHQVGVYYPIFQTGKETWWKYFHVVRHPVLEAQYRPRKHEWQESGCYRCEFKNGSIIYLPAPGFLQNAMSQVSRSFHTLIVGEYTQASVKGEGVDELIGRVRGPNFNKRHPVWANHSLLSAHAESPTHPSYRYFKATRDAVLGKFSQQEQHTNATFTASFRDWSDKPSDTRPGSQSFKERYREDATINRSKRTLPKDEQRRRLHGIWSQDGKGWYPPDVIKNVLRSSILPQCSRKASDEMFALGVDTAPGMSNKADECAFLVWRIVEGAATRGVGHVDPSAPLRSAQDDRLVSSHSKDYTLEVEGRFFHVSLVFGHMLKNVDAGQISGFIHGLHRAFGFSKIVLDYGAGGGGPWIYKELIKTRQLIYNAWTDVIPLCTIDEPNSTDKQPIVVFFKRGGELDTLWVSRFLQSDEGIIEAAHFMLREGFEAQEFLWPQLREKREYSEFQAFNDGEKWAQIYLDIAWKQATGVRVKVDPEGKPMLSARGFRRFEAQGAKKKDAIYAAMYGFCGVKLVMKALLEGATLYEDEVV